MTMNEKWRIRTDWFDLDANSLADRIINVCFVISKDGAKQRRIVIRSDFQPFWTEKGTYTIGKVVYKPDMTFSCNNYSSESAVISINAKLTIRNLFYQDKEGKLTQNLSNLEEGESISKVIIQLGYWGNFKNLNLKSIADLEDNFDQTEANAQRGISTFVSEDGAYYLQTKGVPPQAITEAVFFIGSFNKIEAPDTETVISLEPLNSDSLTKALDASMSDEAKQYVEEVKETKEEDAMATKEMDRVYRSGLQFYNILVENFGIEAKMIDTNNGKAIVIPKADWEENHNGIENILKGIGVKKSVIEAFGHELPAVYSVEWTEFCTVSCPFFFWVDSMQWISLNSAYETTSMIQYYVKGNNRANHLSAIESSLVFSTVGKDNRLTIMCRPE